MLDYTKTLAYQVLLKFQTYKSEVEKYACIGEYCPIPCFITAHDGFSVLYVNPAFIEMTGCTIEHMGRENWPNMFLPEEFEQVISNWEMFVKTRQPFRVQQRWVHVNTKKVTNVYNYVHAVDGNGFVGFLVPLDGNKLTDSWFPRQDFNLQPDR